MRSSKSRSRSKSNRPRTMGNIVNRVFDSSGPEGKVRGTPQQIIEKYLFLARDAQLSNDRVAAENFLQHAEHYTRMLGEAQREMAAEQEARQPQAGYQQGGNPQAGNGNGQPGNGNGNGNGGSQNQPYQQNRDRRDDRPEFRADYRNDDRQPDHGHSRQPDVIDVAEADDTGLVETPEARHAPKPRRDAPEPASFASPADIVAQVEASSDANAEAKPDRGPRRPRAPRKPRTEKAETDGNPQETAE